MEITVARNTEIQYSTVLCNCRTEKAPLLLCWNLFVYNSRKSTNKRDTSPTAHSIGTHPISIEHLNLRSNSGSTTVGEQLFCTACTVWGLGDLGIHQPLGCPQTA